MPIGNGQSDETQGNFGWYLGKNAQVVIAVDDDALPGPIHGGARRDRQGLGQGDGAAAAEGDGSTPGKSRRQTGFAALRNDARRLHRPTEQQKDTDQHEAEDSEKNTRPNTWEKAVHLHPAIPPFIIL